MDHDFFEVEILQTIRQHQPQLDDDEEGGKHVLGLIDTFDVTSAPGQHRVIAMPVVGRNLGAFARQFPQARIPVQTAKKITLQLLSALAFLHETCGAIHTDLQPSNICFQINSWGIQRVANEGNQDRLKARRRNEEVGSIRTIDFGVASWIDKHLSDNIQPEHLRASEVILGAPWGPLVDVWSLGCLVIEYVKGHIAFNGAAAEHGTWNSNDDHLAQHMEVLGPMPMSLFRRGSRTSEYFKTDGTLLRIPELQHTSLKEHMDGRDYPFRRPDDMSAADAVAFVDFLRGALALEPDQRKTASELSKHTLLDDVRQVVNENAC